MYINPFCAGVFTTIVVECVVFAVWVIYLGSKK